MSQAKERPILFSGPMVRAILDGRKTVTRRLIKPSMRGFDVSFELHQQEDGSWRPMHTFDESSMDDQGTEHPIACPYGQIGDRLWVREAWAQVNVAQAPGESWVVYRECDNRTDYGGPWKPSIHMRRRDSRILLEITDVRVERLQDISEDQAKAEGMVYTDFGMQERPGRVHTVEPAGRRRRCTPPGSEPRDRRDEQGEPRHPGASRFGCRDALLGIAEADCREAQREPWRRYSIRHRSCRS